MKKPLARFSNLSRVALESHFRTAMFQKESAYTAKAFLTWARDYLRYFLLPKHKFIGYSGPDNGVYGFPTNSKIALAGDLGTGTEEAAQVGERIQEFGADYTIHLGDVYYVGNTPEIDENFLGVSSDEGEFEPVRWPRGGIGSFSLNGNHEMYSNGNGYFDVLLPMLGQKASFFCLQNKYWKIVALDTGYYSTGLFASAKLPKPLMEWLDKEVFAKDTGQGIILLSHHQPWTAFDYEKGYPAAARQLWEFIHRPVLWFWGHEHKMILYDKFSVKGSIEAYGRCIGHGGMPINICYAPNAKKAPWQVYDMRSYPNSEGLHVGFNGHAELEFTERTLGVTYKDLNGKFLLSESWETTPYGILHGGINRQPIDLGLMTNFAPAMRVVK